jgi:S-layer protein
LALTTGSDTIDGTTALDSLADSDVVTDASTTDADVLSANLTNATQKPVLVAVETLNINARYGDAGLDLSNVTGTTTINATSTTAAGSLTFSNVAANAVKTIAAGSNVSSLTVTAKDVAAGTSGTVTVQGAAGTSSMTVTGNKGTDTFNIEMASAGSLALDGNAGTDTYNIKLAGGSTTVTGDTANETVNFESAVAANTVTVASALTATSTGKSTITGNKDFTLNTTSALITGVTVTDSTTAGTTKVEISATTDANDLSKVAVDEIELKAVTADHALTFANGAVVRMSNNNGNDLEINAVGASDSITFIANGQVQVTNDTTKFVTVNMSNTKDVVADMILAGAATLNLSGAYKFTLDGDTTAKHVDATNMTGVLVAVADAGVLKVTGGAGADQITATDVDIASGGEQTYEISTGAGNDKVTIAGTVTFDTDIDNKMIIDGGTGSNTLTAGTTAAIDFSSFAGGLVSTIANFSTIDLTAASMTLAQKQGLTNGNTYAVKGDGAADVFTIAVVDGGGSPFVDMSGVTVSGVATLVVNASAYTAGSTTLTGSGTVGTTIIGSAQKDVVVAGSGVDTIYTDAGADVITGGSGADLFLIGAAASMVGADNVRHITDFVAGTDKFKIVVDDTASTPSITGDLSAASAILDGVTYDGTGDAVSTMGDVISSTDAVATIAEVYTKLATLLDATALTASAAGGTGTTARVVDFTTGAAAGKYLVLNDDTAGFAAAVDIVINVTGVTGTISASDFAFSAT